MYQNNAICLNKVEILRSEQHANCSDSCSSHFEKCFSLLRIEPKQMTKTVKTEILSCFHWVNVSAKLLLSRFDIMNMLPRQQDQHAFGRPSRSRIMSNCQQYCPANLLLTGPRCELHFLFYTLLLSSSDCQQYHPFWLHSPSPSSSLSLLHPPHQRAVTHCTVHLDCK